MNRFFDIALMLLTLDYTDEFPQWLIASIHEYEISNEMPWSK